MNRLHLNCDAGEDDSIELAPDFQDAFKYISAANIACGAHAGSKEIIEETTIRCLTNDVQIGLHPSYDDRLNFGRKVQNPGFDALYETISNQLHFAAGIVTNKGGDVTHVKPHGALYNQTAKDAMQCEAVYKAIASFNSEVWVYGLPGTCHEKTAKALSLNFLAEGFGDRNYQSATALRSREYDDSILVDADKVVKHVGQLLNGGVETFDGVISKLDVNTICIHGDNSNLLSILKALEENFEISKR